MTNQEVVVKFLNGFNRPEKLQESLDLLAGDYKFKDPIMEHNSKDAFITVAKEMANVLTGIDIITTAESDDWVGAFYEFKTSIPSLEVNRASEWFRLKGGIIQESHLVFDATGWRSVFKQMEQ